MAYPLTSELANLTCTSGAGDLHYLFGTAIRVTGNVASFNLESNEYDATTPSGSAINMRTINAGIRTGTLAFEGLYPRAANPLGLTASITQGGTPIPFVREISLTITWPEIDITNAGSSTPTARRWMPGGTGSWAGTFMRLAPNDAPPTLPTTGTATSTVFKLAEDGVADPTLTGSITTPRYQQTVRIGGESALVYSFTGSGDLVQAAGTALPGLFAASGAISKPTWDSNGDGVPDNTCRLLVASGRYYDFPAFWTSITLKWVMDQPVQVTGTLRVADAVTAT
jgi:hypothetical protein